MSPQTYRKRIAALIFCFICAIFVNLSYINTNEGNDKMNNIGTFLSPNPKAEEFTEKIPDWKAKTQDKILKLKKLFISDESPTELTHPKMVANESGFIWKGVSYYLRQFIGQSSASLSTDLLSSDNDASSSGSHLTANGNSSTSWRPRRLKSLEEFFDYMETSGKFPCKKKVLVGGVFNRWTGLHDGDKMVCMDQKMGLEKENCIVLSFGINNEWSFDDAMGKYGCKVYSFDPTMAQGDHQRSKNVTFLHLGLSDINGTKIITQKKCKVDTFEGILHRLGLTNTTIDYVKMDIEKSELNWFKDMFSRTPKLFSRIRQVGMEIHPAQQFYSLGPSRLVHNYYYYFQLMEHIGFQLLYATPNEVPVNLYQLNGKQRSGCYELVWVNTRILAL